MNMEIQDIADAIHERAINVAEETKITQVDKLSARSKRVPEMEKSLKEKKYNFTIVQDSRNSTKKSRPVSRKILENNKKLRKKKCK